MYSNSIKNFKFHSFIQNNSVVTLNSSKIRRKISPREEGCGKELIFGALECGNNIILFYADTFFFTLDSLFAHRPNGKTPPEILDFMLM